MVQFIITNVSPFLCSIFQKDGVHYQSWETFKLSYLNKMSTGTAQLLNIDQIKKYNEANHFVDALEDKPVWFKNYKLN